MFQDTNHGGLCCDTLLPFFTCGSPVDVTGYEPSSTPAPFAPSDPLPSSPCAIMSSDSTRSLMGVSFLVLTKSTFLKWRVCVMRYGSS